MTKNGRTRRIVWLCICTAIAAALLLFFFLPRRADRLMHLPAVSEVQCIVLEDSLVTPNGYSRFNDTHYTTGDTALMQELYRLLAQTKLRFVQPTGGIKTYPEGDGSALYILSVWNDESVYRSLTLRTDGIVYCGKYGYRMLDKALVGDYLSLFARIRTASEEESQISGSISQERFEAFQKLFDAPSWYAQAVSAPFTDRDVNLGSMFYDGLSYDESGTPVYGSYVTPEDAGEWAWTQENVPGATEVDVSRLPREGMYRVLSDTLYGLEDIPDDLAPEGWIYWDKTDCWYHAHGDTGINSVTLTEAILNADGSGYFQFVNAFERTCVIYFNLGKMDADAEHLYLRACVAQ